MHVDISVVGGLALPLLAAHLIADHPLQPSSWAAAKGSCDHAGRVACAKHTVVVVGLQALAVLAVVGLTGVAVSPLARNADGLGSRQHNEAGDDAEDTALAEYNAYLAELNAREQEGN